MFRIFQGNTLSLSLSLALEVVNESTCIGFKGLNELARESSSVEWGLNLSTESTLVSERCTAKSLNGWMFFLAALEKINF